MGIGFHCALKFMRASPSSRRSEVGVVERVVGHYPNQNWSFVGPILSSSIPLVAILEPILVTTTNTFNSSHTSILSLCDKQSLSHICDQFSPKMAKGRGSALNLFLVALVVLFVIQCSLLEVQGATYVVGGPQGWSPQIQKSRWTVGKRFKAGDVLVFKYAQGAHDVVSVNSGGYKSCNKGASPSLTSGNDKITLKKGPNYFICSFTGHCPGGMKITVVAA